MKATNIDLASRPSGTPTWLPIGDHQYAHPCWQRDYCEWRASSAVEWLEALSSIQHRSQHGFATSSRYPIPAIEDALSVMKSDLTTLNNNAILRAQRTGEAL